jgi:predicted nucleic acid-binding protein
VRCLLDVNALVALGIFHHRFHDRVNIWITSQVGALWLTCSITELGFARVIAQTPDYGFTVQQARTLLLGLKTNSRLQLSFQPDGHDISHLPSWVKTPKQTTDGHLVELARANDAVLATLDEGIPGAFLIP